MTSIRHACRRTHRRAQRRALGLACLLAVLESSSTRPARALEPPPQERVLSFFGKKLSFPEPVFSLPTGFTFETWLWVESNDPANPTGIFFAGDLRIGLRSTGEMAADRTAASVQAPSPFPLRRWVHVAVRSGPAAMALLLDGAIVATGPGVALGIPPTDIEVGGAGGSFTLLGSLRQFRFWKVELSEAEIRQVAETPPNPADARLAAWWPMDDGKVESLSRDLVEDLGPLGLDLLDRPRLTRWTRPAVLAAGPFLRGRFYRTGYSLQPFPRLLDVDRDGDLDLFSFDPMVVPKSPHPPYWDGEMPGPDRAFRNDGDGQFTEATEAILGAERTQIYFTEDAFVADFTGDGAPDLLVPDTGLEDGEVWVPNQIWVGRSQGRLDNESSTRMPQQPDYEHRSAFGDIDGDGDLDIVSAGWLKDENGAFVDLRPVLAFINDGRGFFTTAFGRSPEITFPGVPNSQSFLTSVALVDADLDGDLDLFVGDLGSHPHNRMLLNDGIGRFSLAPVSWLPAKRRFPGDNWPCGYAVPGYNGNVEQSCRLAVEALPPVDLDRDGLLDVIFNNLAGADKPGPRYPYPQLMLGNGDGSFRDGSSRVAPPWVMPADVHKFSHPTGGLIFDANGDGWSDFAFSESGVNIQGSLFINHGSQGFEEASDALFSGRELRHWDAGDLDGDGDLDLVVGAQVLDNEKPYAPNDFPDANLRLAMSLGGSAPQLTQTVTVVNEGSVAAPRVALAIPVPHGYKRQGTTPGPGACGTSGHVVTCKLATLAAGASWQVVVRSKAQAKPEFTATHAVASVTADVDDPDLRDNVQRVTLVPTGSWLNSPAVPGFEFKFAIANGNTKVPGKLMAGCLAETLCVAGSNAAKAEALARVVRPPAGVGGASDFWPALARLTPARVEAWVRQSSTGRVGYYELPANPSGSNELPGWIDRTSFSEAAAVPLGADEPATEAGPAPPAAPAPPAGTWLTSSAIPGFRFKARIGGSKPIVGKAVTPCLAGTLCVAAKPPTRTEVLVRVEGPAPTNFLRPTVAKFTTAKVELWIQKVNGGQINYYLLPETTTASHWLAGVFDARGFRP